MATVSYVISKKKLKPASTSGGDPLVAAVSAYQTNGGNISVSVGNVATARLTVRDWRNFVVPNTNQWAMDWYNAIKTAAIQRNGLGICIESIYVDPAHHSSGIGKQLLDKIKSAAKNVGCIVYLADASESAFYSNAGFSGNAVKVWSPK